MFGPRVSKVAYFSPSTAFLVGGRSLTLGWLCWSSNCERGFDKAALLLFSDLAFSGFELVGRQAPGEIEVPGVHGGTDANTVGAGFENLKEQLALDCAWVLFKAVVKLARCVGGKEPKLLNQVLLVVAGASAIVLDERPKAAILQQEVNPAHTVAGDFTDLTVSEVLCKKLCNAVVTVAKLGNRLFATPHRVDEAPFLGSLVNVGLGDFAAGINCDFDRRSTAAHWLEQVLDGEPAFVGVLVPGAGVTHCFYSMQSGHVVTLALGALVQTWQPLKVVAGVVWRGVCEMSRTM